MELSSFSTSTANKLYYQETLEYLKIIDEDGFNPDFVNVESWYNYPDRLFPETGHYTFMDLLKDFGEAFDQLKNKPRTKDQL